MPGTTTNPTRAAVRGALLVLPFVTMNAIVANRIEPFVYAVNAVLATLLGIVFVVLSVGLGSEIYRCDILGIPNCN